MPDTPSKRQMNVRLPPDLIDEVDARRAKRGLSRDVWVERALRYALSTAPSTRRPASKEPR